jgi:hypothetical protein
MAAFKAHCAFGFWHPLMRDGDTSLEGLGRFGKIASIGHLPSAGAFTKLAKKARKLVDEGVKGPARPKPDPSRRLAVPRDLSETRAQRIATTVQWVAEGNSRHWRYETA